MKALPTSPVARAKEKERRAGVKARKAARKVLRAARRAAKALPRKNLKEWARAVCKVGACEVCGQRAGIKKDAQGNPVMTRPKEGSKRKPVPIFIPLNAAHILPKEHYPELKLEPLNGVCTCPRHHKYGKYSCHKNPLWWVLWLRRHCPERYAWARAHMGLDPQRLR